MFRLGSNCPHDQLHIAGTRLEPMGFTKNKLKIAYLPLLKFQLRWIEVSNAISTYDKSIANIIMGLKFGSCSMA